MELAYLDHAAATPLRSEVRESMAPLLDRLVGNPSSPHRWGREARRSLEEARERVAACLRRPRTEIHFVRGGTESVNLAVLGRGARFLASRAVRAGNGRDVRTSVPATILHSALEHSAVRGAAESLGRRGLAVREFRVSPAGEAEFPDSPALLDQGVVLVSSQWVNHESGLILPIARIATTCREAGVPLHVDAVQAIGRIPLDPALPDLLSLSGHKLGGPRSSGILAVRGGIELDPVLHGGGQEQGLRPGTEDVAAAIGLAAALELSLSEAESSGRRLGALRDALQHRLCAAVPELRVIGAGGPRSPHILLVALPDIPRDVLPGALDLEGVGASAGSACRSGSSEPSPTLRTLCGEDADRLAPLRFSLGWTTTAGEIDRAVAALSRVVERIAQTGTCATP